jgi:hypothetical protein
MMAGTTSSPLLRQNLASLGAFAGRWHSAMATTRTAVPLPEEPVTKATVSSHESPLEASAAFAEKQVVQQAGAEKATGDALRNEAMVFEVGLTFVVMHYQSIFIGVMRCLFQSFRPLLILFVFGQILKAVFFIMGTPIWFSFYSIWLFEVGYGLAQCAISFIFISFFYNNLSMARVRPTLAQFWRQCRDRVSRMSAALC